MAERFTPTAVNFITLLSDVLERWDILWATNEACQGIQNGAHFTVDCPRMHPHCHVLVKKVKGGSKWILLQRASDSLSRLLKVDKANITQVLRFGPSNSFRSQFVN